MLIGNVVILKPDILFSQLSVRGMYLIACNVIVKGFLYLSTSAFFSIPMHLIRSTSMYVSASFHFDSQLYI
jgi:hypothetical protein